MDEFFDAPEARAHAALRGQKSKLVSAIFFLVPSLEHMHRVCDTRRVVCV